MKKISIIIPVFNAKKTLKLCLEHIFSLDDSNFEVIVVDDGSADDSVKICDAYNVKLVTLRNRQGPSVARNTGAEEAEGEIIAFTDSDCMVPPDWLTKIRKHLTDDNNEIVTGGYKADSSQNILGRFINYDIHNHGYRHLPAETDILTGGNFALFKSIMNTSPKIEDRIFGTSASAEDTVLGMVLSKKHKIHYYKDMDVVHLCSAGLIYFFKKSFMRGFTKTIIFIMFRSSILNSKNISYKYIAGHLLLTLFITFSFVSYIINKNVFLVASAFIAYLSFLVYNDLSYIYMKEKKIVLPVISVFLLYFRDLCFMFGAGAGLLHYFLQIKFFKEKREAYLKW